MSARTEQKEAIRRKVLIPLDGSEFSRHIFSAVSNLIDPQKHTLILLRVVPIPHFMNDTTPPIVSPAYPYGWYLATQPHEGQRTTPTLSELEESQRSAIKDELLRYQYQMEEHGYHVLTAVRFGEAAREIIDYAKSADVDMVAMATHGRSGLMHLLMGSVAEQVLHRLTVPILLLRPEPVSVMNEQAEYEAQSV